MKPQMLRSMLAAVVSLLSLPAAAVTPAQLAVVINADDPDSAALAEYYRVARGLDASQLYTMHLGTGDSIEPLVFQQAWSKLNRELPASVQGLALAWMRPWRAQCLSVTSAMTFGYDKRYCATGCERTAPSKLFASESDMPYRDHGLRPAMMLHAGSPEASRALIDRGVAADATRPRGTAYLVSTSDRNRNVRSREYAGIEQRFGSTFDIAVEETDALRGRHDVMFYFTGRKHVADIESNAFLPGAVADHLTSIGGCLVGCNQMSALRWLEAGATGTYGTVAEPCNFPQKFPSPSRLIRHYLGGDTLIEAYWKSVRWPGQGLFLGEPLARPF